VAGPLAGWVTRPEQTNGVAVVLLPAVGYGHSTDHRILVVRFARGATSAWPKMYRSGSLEPGQIDNLYSELVCVPW
jgi:hypothetical protein